MHLHNLTKEDAYIENKKEIEGLRELIKTNNCKWNFMSENQELKNKLAEYEKSTDNKNK